MFPPGLRLRQSREKLGLTYRDVERASYDIAVNRGRPEFILHISRLADIENRNIIPSLHKLYSLAVIYHLNPLEITSWYEAPLAQTINDELSHPPQKTHLTKSFVPEPFAPLPMPPDGDAPFDTDKTNFLSAMPHELSRFPGLKTGCSGRLRYGYIGLSDRRMVPLLRPGSIVLVDTSLRRIEDADWTTEYDRPLYFVELRDGYRCGWFQHRKSRLIMQPHMLSRCSPESWAFPEHAEIAGQVVGVVSYLNEPWACNPEAIHLERASSNGRVL